MTACDQHDAFANCVPRYGSGGGTRTLKRGLGFPLSSYRTNINTTTYMKHHCALSIMSRGMLQMGVSGSGNRYQATPRGCQRQDIHYRQDAEKRVRWRLNRVSTSQHHTIQSLLSPWRLLRDTGRTSCHPGGT